MKTFSRDCPALTHLSLYLLQGGLPLPLPVLLASALAIPLIILNFSQWGRMNRSKCAASTLARANPSRAFLSPHAVASRNATALRSRRTSFAPPLPPLALPRPPRTEYRPRVFRRVAHTLHLDNVHVSEWVHSAHGSSSGRPVDFSSTQQTCGALSSGSLPRLSARDPTPPRAHPPAPATLSAAPLNLRLSPAEIPAGALAPQRSPVSAHLPWPV